MREREQAMKKHTTTITCLLYALIIGSATLHSCQWLGTSEAGGNRGTEVSVATQTTAATASAANSTGGTSAASSTGIVGGSDAGTTNDNHSNTELLSLPEDLPFAALPQQQLPQAGLSFATLDEVANCPLPLADYCSQLSYKATDYSMQWQGETQLTLPQAAEQLLKALAIDGWVLEKLVLSICTVMPGAAWLHARQPNSRVKLSARY